MNNFFSDSKGKRSVMAYNDLPYHVPKRQRLAKSTSAASISDDEYSNGSNYADYDSDILLTPTNCHERPFSLSAFPQAPRRSAKNIFLVSENEDCENRIFRTEKLPCLPLIDDVSTTSYCNRLKGPWKLSIRRSPMIVEDESVTENAYSNNGNGSSTWDSFFSPTCATVAPLNEPPKLKRKKSIDKSNLSMNTSKSSIEDGADEGIFLYIGEADVSLLHLPSLSTTCCENEEANVAKPRLLCMRPRAISHDE